MLNSGEKSYCAALLALKGKDYFSASEHFRKAAPYFENDREFNLYYETTRLLITVKQELAQLDHRDRDRIEIEEVFSNG